MPAYVVVTREKTRDAGELEQYKQLTPLSFKEHPAIIRAIHGRTEVLEGSAVEELIVLEFPTYEDAKSWYHSWRIKPHRSFATRAATTGSSWRKAFQGINLGFLNYPPGKIGGPPSPPAFSVSVDSKGHGFPVSPLELNLWACL